MLTKTAALYRDKTYISVILLLGKTTCFLLGACSLFFISPTYASSVKDNLLNGTSISICDDVNEWPPFTYFERIDGKKSNKVVGFSIDVLDDIFSRHNMRYTITMLPWSRCVLEVQNGKKYQMVIDFTSTSERRKNYFISNQYYTTTTHYYYSKKQFPQGLVIKAMADLRRYRVCGIHGFSVNHTNFPDFFKPGEVDQSAKDYPTVIAKLHLKHCDLFLSEYEAMLGFSKVGDRLFEDPNLANAPMPDLLPSVFRFGISRQYNLGENLLTLIDQELSQMEASGRLKALWKKRNSQ
jgi:polar amino acid transport system substrate-binding protein